MVELGDPAPEFTAPLAGGDAYNDISEFTLSDEIGDGSIVLAFVPGAFTGGCTKELTAFNKRLDEFERRGANIYGISVDLPFAQNVWIEQEGWNLSMLSDCNSSLIKRYDVVLDELYGMIQSAERSVFVINESGDISYRWVREGENPDFEVLVEEVLATIQ